MKDNNAEEKILAAALSIVNEKTIAGTRMHLIAERAGMVTSNVHYYFKTKDLLLDALQSQVTEICMNSRVHLRNLYPDTLDGQLDVFIRQKLDFIKDHPEYDCVEIDFWSQGHINSKVRKKAAFGFGLWREDAYQMFSKYAPELPEKTRKALSYMLISLLEGATIQYQLEEFDVNEYFKYCKHMILHAIDTNWQG